MNTVASHTPSLVAKSSFADSSDKLSLQEPGEGFGIHLTAIPILGITGGSSIEREEIFTSKSGFTMSHFGATVLHED